MKVMNRYILPAVLAGLNTAATIFAALPAEAKVTVAPLRPREQYVDFTEATFETKPWIKDFKFVVVVNRAETGSDSQTVRVYRDGKLVDLATIQSYLLDINRYESNEKAYADRAQRINELSEMLHDGDSTVFKVSTGRNQFEKKGTNHSQRDSWTVTPTGFYTLQNLSAKHKSEAYSSKLCDSFLVKAVGSLVDKEFCTMMEYAMFFNGSIALHRAIPGTEGALGKKASGGCVRMPGALAEFLFKYSNFERGTKPVPVINTDGTLKTDESGAPVYSDQTNSIWGPGKAWSTLVVVQDQVR